MLLKGCVKAPAGRRRDSASSLLEPERRICLGRFFDDLITNPDAKPII